MKAILNRDYILDSFQQQGELVLEDADAHHLLKVMRTKVGEELLFLNGSGLRAVLCLSKVSGKKISYDLVKKEILDRPEQTSLGIGQVKKDQTDLAIRMLTEVGVSKIYFFPCEYSQEKLPKIDRLEKIIKNSCEQSNNPFAPEVQFIPSWKKIAKNYSKRYFLQPGQTDFMSREGLGPKGLVLIGPEGGWSETEVQELEKHQFQRVSLPTPILRASTAALCAGLILKTGYSHCVNSDVETKL